MMKFDFTWRGATTLALVAVPAAILLLPAAAQNPGRKVDLMKNTDTDKRPFDKHDFTGLWSRNPGQYGQPACDECRDNANAPGYGFFGEVAPRTAVGEKRFQLNKPGRGYELNSKEAKEHPEVDAGYKRAVLPAFGNDPEARCEPLGLARLITFSGGGATMAMTQAKDKIIQQFEWTWDNRDIWTDGRKIPNIDDYLPRYNGYSTGHWEGDTLVVTSAGFDDRQWLDQFGYPMSDKAVLEERWQHPSPNRLLVDLTLTDPVTYTRPWKATRKVWAYIPKDKMAAAGWSGILEDRCIPSDESMFNGFRDHAAGLKK